MKRALLLLSVMLIPVMSMHSIAGTMRGVTGTVKGVWGSMKERVKQRARENYNPTKMHYSGKFQRKNKNVACYSKTIINIYIR